MPAAIFYQIFEPTTKTNKTNIVEIKCIKCFQIWKMTGVPALRNMVDSLISFKSAFN